MFAAAEMLGLRGDRGDRRVRQPADQIDVVGGQILDHADILDPRGKRSAANGRRGEHSTDLAVEQPPAQLLQRRIEALDMADSAVHAGAAADLDDSARVGRRGPTGFSISTETPAGARRSTVGRCRLVGTETIAKSSGPRSQQLVHRVQDQVTVMDRAVAVSAGSTAPTNSTRSELWSSRA